MQQQTENDHLLCANHVRSHCMRRIEYASEKILREKKNNRGLLQSTATMTPITIGQLTNKLFISHWMLNVDH